MILNGSWIETTEGIHTFILWGQNGETKVYQKR